MRKIAIPISVIMLAIGSLARAQDPHHGGAVADTSAHTPYAGMQQRAIKALSNEQIADLRAGRGMGLALAAELNGYPGPSHALELADQLGLSPDQRSRTAAVLAAMRDETIAIGQRVLTGETELDRLFASRSATAESVDAAVTSIATAQGNLRAAHLRYHLQMATVLTPEQATTYARLRGYLPGMADPAATR